jgi:hypothetical protein
MSILALLLMGLLVNSWPVSACGDKLLILGRGVRYQIDTADYPARILLYVNPDSLGSEPFKDTQLQLIVEKAGHRLKSVKSKDELGALLKTGRYDLVLADFNETPTVETIVESTSSQTTVLPWVYNGTQAEKSKAEKRYHLFLKAPASVEQFLSTVDRTMERRAKAVRGKGAQNASLLR